MDRFACQLPGGFIDNDGTVLSQVVLSPLDGFSERLISEKGHSTPASLVTSLLSRSICRIGHIEEVSETNVRSLLAGDRLFLLLKLREITFGREIQAVINCSWDDCAKPVDIDFLTDNIPVKKCPQTSLFYKLEISGQAGLENILFRIPNGEDQELIAHIVDENETLAADMLLSRCTHSFGADTLPGFEHIANLPAQTKQLIEEEIERLSPQVSLNMEAMCPECKRLFTLSFDLQQFILAELHTQLDLLFKEVHYLAFHYHWSEKEILSMTRENRRKYIAVLSDEIERLNHAC